MKSYKDIYYKYITFAIGGAVLIGLSAGFTTIDRRILLGILFVWLVGTTALFQYLAIRRKKKLAELLNQCKISEYVNAYEILDRTFPTFGEMEGRAEIKLNLAGGLYAHGELTEMKRVLNSVKLRNATDSNDLYQKVMYMTNLALYYIERGEYGAAEAELSDCYPLLDAEKFKEPKKSEALEACELAYAILQLKRGEYDGLEDRFKKWILNSVSPLNKVASSYRLGELYFNQDRTAEANKQFEFVVKHGGDTFYAERAAAALKVKGKHRPIL